MSAQHTPGPWKFGFESVDPEWAIVTIEGGLIIANVNADHRQEANARLIAAAPDLLEAAHGVDVLYAELQAALPKIANTRAMDIVQDAVRKARAAIAKAEGRHA